MRFTISVSLIFFLLLAGCASPPAEPAGPKSASAPVKVSVYEAKTEAVPQMIVLSGTLKANQDSEVAANASGQVVQSFVERGTAVRKGDPLVRLDSRAVRLSAAEARANLENAKLQKELSDTQCDRNRHLLERRVISQEEFDKNDSTCQQQEQSVDASEARRRLATMSLSDATVRAPFDGIVSERYVGVGEYVQPSSRVAQIVQADPLRLELTAGESEAGAIRVGQKVSFKVKAFADREFEATVRYVAPSLRDTTRDLVFEAIASNADGALKAGMFAMALLEVGTEENVTLPKTALRTNRDDVRAFVVTAGHLEERILKTGVDLGDRVAIRRGIAAGEKVVASGVDALKDGQQVE
jgi:membrane fusion protein, multidrug efflux system